jgi:hypothetical protein
MIGKVFEIINGIKSDYHSAADNASQYREYQRFYKGGLKERTLTIHYFIDSLKGRLGGCIRKLRFKVESRYAQAPKYLSGLRKDKENGN